jgi:hypothetical protein
MKLDVSKRARRAAERIDARWLEHGDDPKLFARELLETFHHLVSVSAAGTPAPTARRPGLRRILMQKSKCHIYFEIDQRKQVVRVLTVWNAQRERAPKL